MVSALVVPNVWEINVQRMECWSLNVGNLMEAVSAQRIDEQTNEGEVHRVQVQNPGLYIMSLFMRHALLCSPAAGPFVFQYQAS